MVAHQLQMLHPVDDDRIGIGRLQHMVTEELQVLDGRRAGEV